MAEGKGIEVGSVYVSVIPSAKDFGKTLVTQADGQMKAAGTQLGTSLSKSITSSVGTGLATGTSAAIARAGTGQAAASVTRTGQGIGQVLADGVTSTVTAKVGPGLTKAFAGGSSAAKALAADLGSLVGRTASLGVVSRAASGVVGSLGGIASMVGYGGPLGVALAAGGLALGAYSQAQDNASKAAEDLLTTLDKQSGALTQSSLLQFAQKISADLDKPGDVKLLKGLGVNIEDAVVALGKGPAAVDAFIARLEALRATLHNGGAEQGAQIAAIRGLESSLRNQQETLGDTNALWADNTSVQQLATDAARQLGIDVSTTTSVIQSQADAAQNAAAAQAIFQQALDGVRDASQGVIDRINAIPRDVTVTAKDVGLDTLLSKINAIIDAYIRAAAAASAANQIIADGERHGADVSAANRQAGQATAAASAASAAASAALAAHNTAAAAARASRRSRARAVPTFTDTIDVETARTAKQIAKDAAEFITNTVRKGIKTSSALGKQLARQVKQLNAYAVARDKITSKLVAEQKILADLKQKYDDLKQSITQSITSYANVGQALIPGINTAKGFLTRLRGLAADTKAYAKALADLKAAGASPALIEQVALLGVEQGTKVAQTLLSGGSSSVSEANALVKDVASVANTTASTLAQSLYGAGISAAEGLIRGLQSKQSALTATMTNLANAMVAAVKRALGIHSPSRVLFDHGVNTALGFQHGVESGTPGVLSAARAMTSFTGPIDRSSLSIAHAGLTISIDGRILDEVVDYRVDRKGAATSQAARTRQGY